MEWSEIIRGVVSKSNKRALRVRFQITSMISDQNCTTRSSIATLLDTFWNRTIYVPIKSKLKHRPPSLRAYLGHLASFPARERGNLMNLVFPRAGHLITTHRGWGIWSLASISCYESRWYHVGDTSLHAFKAKDTRFVADWLKSKGLHKLCSVFEGIQEPVILSLACKSVVY